MIAARPRSGMDGASQCSGGACSLVRRRVGVYAAHPNPGLQEWWDKSDPEYDDGFGERTPWEFAVSEIR